VGGVGSGIFNEGFEFLFERASAQGAAGVGNDLNRDADGRAGLIAEFDEVFWVSWVK